MYESQTRGDNALLARRVASVLGRARAGLATDVDGTLSQIVARPQDAVVLPRARAALAGLRDVLELVAVISGRRAADARAMVGLDGLVYVGNHGFEVWTGGKPAGGVPEDHAEVLAEARPWVSRLAVMLSDLEPHLPQAGILVENKGATASFHYRLAAEPALARRQLLQLLAGRAGTTGWRIIEGRMVINLLPPLEVSKGSAVTWLARQHKLQRLVYLGDDVTDTHAFTALADLRRTGEAETLSIGVVGRETPPSVRQLIDASIPSVKAVGELLWAVLTHFQKVGRTSASMD